MADTYFSRLKRDCDDHKAGAVGAVIRCEMADWPGVYPYRAPFADRMRKRNSLHGQEPDDRGS